MENALLSWPPLSMGDKVHSSLLSRPRRPLDCAVLLLPFHGYSFPCWRWSSRRCRAHDSFLSVEGTETRIGRWVRSRFPFIWFPLADDHGFWVAAFFCRKIRPCPSVNPSCVSTNPKSSSFAFPLVIPSGSSENSIQVFTPSIHPTIHPSIIRRQHYPQSIIINSLMYSWTSIHRALSLSPSLSLSLGQALMDAIEATQKNVKFQTAEDSFR